MKWFENKRRKQAAERKLILITELLDRLKLSGDSCELHMLDRAGGRIPAKFVFNPQISSMFLSTDDISPALVGALVSVESEDAIFLDEISARYTEDDETNVIRMEIEHYLPRESRPKEFLPSLLALIESTSSSPALIKQQTHA